MKLFNFKNYYFEFHPGLKHWGPNIQYKKTDEWFPYIRFYAFFCYIGKPSEFKD